MRDWSKVAVGEGGGGTDVVADVFAGGRVVLDDDVGGGGAVGGEGGLVREGNGEGFIHLGVVEIGEGVEEVLVVWLRDCELATKFMSPVLSLNFFFVFSFFGLLLIEGRGQFEGGGGRVGQGGERLERVILDILHYFEVPYVQIRSQEGGLDVVP